jgi:hypothetical protein
MERKALLINSPQKTKQMSLLKFFKGNAKLGENIYTFSLPAGYTCPAAKLCQSFANRQSGRITDGKDMQFRCFAASQESTYPSVRAARWHNFDLLKSLDMNAMFKLINRSLPMDAEIVRIHVSGDYFSAEYLNAWLFVARMHPDVLFYSYTKSVHFIPSNIPDNFRITCSEGGKYDDMIGDRKRAKVIFDPIEADILGIDIDHDDSHAYNGDDTFALLVHGVQPKGTNAAAAIKTLKANKVKYSYSKN